MKRELPKLYQLGLAFPKTVLLVSFLVTLLSVIAVSKLTFNSDFASLLPQKTESVRNLNQMEKSFGSYGYVVLTVEGAKNEVAEDFAKRLADVVGKLPEIDYVDYVRPVQFFKDRQWFYLEMEDLQEIERRIDRSLELETKGVSPVFNDLMDFADESD
ncbi:MAG: hypothetical protein K8R69_12000, partial [Deltaproteobacteria bacterium]|nr:hypothetical protein [Deltaproteobacteria bacterium]